jgi:hypothetical protein
LEKSLGNRKTGIFLITGPGHDLNNYRFQDEEHARKWVAQEHCERCGYKVAIKSYKERRCCRDPYAFIYHGKFTIKQFLEKPKGYWTKFMKQKEKEIYRT